MPTDGELPPELADAVARLDELVKRFEEHPDPAVKDRVFELLSCVDTVHRAGLRRLHELIEVAGLEKRALEDPEIRLLFELYDLGEGGPEDRVGAVVDSLRSATGLDLEVVEASAETVRVRVASVADFDVRHTLEQALRDALDDLTHVEVVSSPPNGNFVPLSDLVIKKPPLIQPVVPLAELDAAVPCWVDVQGERVLLVKFDDGIRAYRNACPGTPFPLEAGTVCDGELACPWHGCRFELRTGERIDRGGVNLESFATDVTDGMVRVAVPHGLKA